MESITKIDGKCLKVQDLSSFYFDEERITPFQWKIDLSNTVHWILEPCFEGERGNIIVVNGSSTPYFYMHLYVIHDLRVLIPFTPFEAKFLAIANVSPSQVMPNV